MQKKTAKKTEKICSYTIFVFVLKKMPEFWFFSGIGYGGIWRVYGGIRRVYGGIPRPPKKQQILNDLSGLSVFGHFTKKGNPVKFGESGLWLFWKGRGSRNQVALMSSATLLRGVELTRGATMSLECDPLYLSMMEEKKSCRFLDRNQYQSICFNNKNYLLTSVEWMVKPIALKNQAWESWKPNIRIHDDAENPTWWMDDTWHA